MGGNLTGVKMRFDMVDREQRDIQNQRQGLGGGESHEQRSNQAWMCCDSNRADFVERHVGLAQGLVDHWQNALDMGPRRNLWNDAAEALVQFVLRRDDVRQNSPLVIDDGSSGFIAR